jgi:hypothetical protein
LRGCEDIHTRYLVHVASYNLGFLMCTLYGAGTPGEAANARFAFLFIIQAAEGNAFVIFAASDAVTTALIVAVSAEPAQPKRHIFRRADSQAKKDGSL